MLSRSILEGLGKLRDALSLFASSLSMEDLQTQNSKKIYETAKANLGIDITPEDVVPDTLGCAEAVNKIFTLALGKPIGGGPSTAEMFKYLQDSSRFLEVDKPLPGDVIISPTGSGDGTMPHGHVGIVAIHGIISNDSETGTLALNFTMASWLRLYHAFGGFPVRIFRVR